MEIQSAGILDLGALRRLERVCFEKDAWSLLDLMAVLTWSDVIRLKAVEGGEMIGFIAGDPRQANGVGWIATLAVDPRFQRRGIGSALLRACEQQFNLPIIKLTVRASNHGAIALYQRTGYRIIDTWLGYYSDGEDGLVMLKTI